eukprot:10987911-Alexandrium_andersonii.AAC.1
MFATILDEIAQQPRTQVAIGGDFNCELHSIGPLQELLASGQLVDVAASQKFTSEPEALRTCKAHGAQAWHRRDFMLLSPGLADQLVKVSIDQTMAFDVHVPLTCTFRLDQMPPTRQLLAPQPFLRPQQLTRAQWASALEAAAIVHFEPCEPDVQHLLQAGDVDGFWRS